MKSQTVIVHDILSSYIDDVQRVARQKKHQVMDRATIAEFLLDAIPQSWADILRKTKVAMLSAGKNDPLSPRSAYGDSRIYLDILKSNASLLNSRTEDLTKSGAKGPAVDALITAMSDWPAMTSRPHRAQVMFKGQPCECWQQELAILALIPQSYIWRGIPEIAWRLRIGVLFPKPRQGSALDKLPEVRIEILDTAGPVKGMDTDEFLTITLQRVMSRVCEAVAWSLADAYEADMDTMDIGKAWPMAVQIVFQEDQANLAATFLASLQEPNSAAWIMSLIDDLHDNRVDLMRVECRTGPHPDQPVVKAKSPSRAALPISDQPGAAFLLIECELSSVTLGKDGHICRAISIERCQKFEDEYGQTAESLLNEVGLPRTEIDQIEEYEEIMTQIAIAAAEYGYDDDDILREAVTFAGYPKAAKAQPKMRILLDLATGMQSVEFYTGKASMQSFLNRMTAPGSRLGAHPAQLKVSRLLLTKHPEIADWASQNKVELIFPTSGADAGAKYVRLWNKTAEGILWWQHAAWWQRKEHMPFEQFKDMINQAAACLCREPRLDTDPTDLPSYHFPASLFVNVEARASFQEWRDSR